ncbi:MAG: CTP synthase [Dehalococcoidia bacterium]
MAKFIFVTGGVVSSVGKGITTASLGRILKSRGVTVSIQKLDPYLNVDPGTMSPYQHGEVFVTVDGAETDLDLGHYERFIDQDLTAAASVTSGRIYQAVLDKERRGDYLGGTIQAVPHLTNEIKGRIYGAAKQAGCDVLICEVGGTVGDIEGESFLEAIRQIRHERSRTDTLSIHVCFLPFVGATGELKTKPTQHSVRELRSKGIQPDVIILRSDQTVPRDISEKVALFCDVEPRGVVPLETVASIYEVPLVLEQRGLGDVTIEKLSLEGPRDLDDWRAMVERMKHPTGTVTVSIVGKYVKLKDAYLSVKEALVHGGIANGVDVDIQWVSAESLETRSAAEVLAGSAGIIVPGGFGERGWEGKIKAANYARTAGVPYLGLCLGMQVMVTEFARNVCGLEGANSTEFDPESPHPVISLLEDQTRIVDKGGTMRRGAYPCSLKPGSLAASSFATDTVSERHRHRWEFNNAYRDQLEGAGLRVSGTSPDGSLVEISEIAGHPFMLGTQFHPELQSRPNRPHPLFREFIAAAVRKGAPTGK